MEKFEKYLQEKVQNLPVTKSGSAAEPITIKWSYFRFKETVIPFWGDGNLQEPELTGDHDVSLSTTNETIDDQEVFNIAEIADESTDVSSSASMFSPSPASSMSKSAKREQIRETKNRNAKESDMIRFFRTRRKAIKHYYRMILEEKLSTPTQLFNRNSVVVNSVGFMSNIQQSVLN